MEPTREQLQAEILEILYQKCVQKPIWVSCAEIFWSISNLKVSERSVRDVLDWLVKNDLVVYQADRYQIAKREFMDMSRRKALEKKETVDDGTSGPPRTVSHHPRPEGGCQQPAAKSSNTMFAITALTAFLISGTLVGILLFNSFAKERRNSAELTYLPDGIQVQPLQAGTPGYIRDAYAINRNFKSIQTSLATQQRINAELADICKVQQSQINILTACAKQQAADIEHWEKERKIYTWMVALALLVLSSLLVCRYGGKN